jgi:hypothetical protein
MFYYFIVLSNFYVVTFKVHYSDFSLRYKKGFISLNDDTVSHGYDIYSLFCRVFAAKSMDIVAMTIS